MRKSKNSYAKVNIAGGGYYDRCNCTHNGLQSHEKLRRYTASKTVLRLCRNMAAGTLVDRIIGYVNFTQCVGAIGLRHTKS